MSAHRGREKVAVPKGSGAGERGNTVTLSVGIELPEAGYFGGCSASPPWILASCPRGGSRSVAVLDMVEVGTARFGPRRA